MLRASGVLVAAAFLGLHAHAALESESGSYKNRLTKCVHHCEAANACHTSLESFACEASCQTVCECKARSRHMLNKPKHCTATMLAEQQKKLSLLRKSKSKLTKVQLKDEPDEPHFDSYVALEDFWPGGKKADAEASESKPRMLNALAVSRSPAMPWSRGAGRHGLKRHKKHKAASMAQVEKFLYGFDPSENATKAKNATEAKPATPKAAAAKVEDTSKPQPAQKDQKAPKLTADKETKASNVATSAKTPQVQKKTSQLQKAEPTKAAPSTTAAPAAHKVTTKAAAAQAPAKAAPVQAAAKAPAVQAAAKATSKVPTPQESTKPSVPKATPKVAEKPAKK